MAGVSSRVPEVRGGVPFPLGHDHRRQLSRRAVPPLPGPDDVAGSTFSSATWRHDHDVTGRRVAVVGTGAWLRAAFRRVPGLPRLNRAATYVQYEILDGLRHVAPASAGMVAASTAALHDSGAALARHLTGRSPT